MMTNACLSPQKVLTFRCFMKLGRFLEFDAFICIYTIFYKPWNDQLGTPTFVKPLKKIKIKNYGNLLISHALPPLRCPSDPGRCALCGRPRLSRRAAEPGRRLAEPGRAQACGVWPAKVRCQPRQRLRRWPLIYGISMDSLMEYLWNIYGISW